jgi:hypothetical protein
VRLTLGSTAIDPIQRAVTGEVLDEFGSRQYLTFFRRLPSGRICYWYAWTAGGAPFGDIIDTYALAAGLDGLDGLCILARNHTRKNFHRGAIEIAVYDLDPIAAEVFAAVKVSDAERARLCAGILRRTGQSLAGRSVPWLGVGPRVINACTRA